MTCSPFSDLVGLPVHIPICLSPAKDTLLPSWPLSIQAFVQGRKQPHRQPVFSLQYRRDLYSFKGLEGNQKNTWPVAVTWNSSSMFLGTCWGTDMRGQCCCLPAAPGLRGLWSPLGLQSLEHSQSMEALVCRSLSLGLVWRPFLLTHSLCLEYGSTFPCTG